MQQRIQQMIKNQEIYIDERTAVFFPIQGIQYLLSQNTTKVQKITINKRKLPDISFKIHFKPDFSSLKLLYLKNNNLRNLGCKYLSEINFPLLEQFSLATNQISDAGVSHLYKINAPQLIMLSLYNNKISVKGIQYLIRLPSKKLQKISLDLMQNIPYNQLMKLILFQSSKLKMIYFLQTQTLNKQPKYSIKKLLYYKHLFFRIYH